jgi:hypothetical protein
VPEPNVEFLFFEPSFEDVSGDKAELAPVV